MSFRFLGALTLFLLATLVFPYQTTAEHKSLAPDPEPLIVPDIHAPAVPGEFIAQFRPSTSAVQKDASLSKLGARVTRRIEPLGLEVLEVPGLTKSSRPAMVEAKLKQAKNDPNIVFLEPNYLYTASYLPNDSNYGDQWAWNVIQAPRAWDVTRGDTNVTIAVIDTGIQLTHPDLKDKIVGPGADFVSNDGNGNDENGHGTHVAGSAAAATNNNLGGAGTCPLCRLLPVRVLDAYGSGTLSDVADGIMYAATQRADVINLSLGGPGSFALQQAVNYAWSSGTFLACAAGNSSTSSTNYAYPGAYSACFAVGATTPTDQTATFSNFGSWVEIGAPGINIYSSSLGSGYRRLDGTSMAAPHVAGAAGLLASMGLDNSQIRSRLCSTATRTSATGRDYTCGRLNIAQAVLSAQPTPTPRATSTPVPTSTPPPPTSTPVPTVFVPGNVIVNSGFEDGNLPWGQVSAGNYPLIHDTPARTGRRGAVLSGFSNGGDSLFQDVTVPTGGKLTYYLRVISDDVPTEPRDYLRVKLYTIQGAPISILRTWSNATLWNIWIIDHVDLSAYAGQTLRIQFESKTDAQNNTLFNIDDVTLSP